MSIRKQILADVRSTLKQITKQQDYLSDVGSVVSGDVSSVDITSAVISIGVYVSQYQVGPNDLKFDRVIDLTKTIAIAAHAIIRTNVDDAEDAMSDLMDDMETAIFEDRRRGVPSAATNTISILFSQEVVSKNGSGALAEFLATILVTWKGDPQTP